MKIPKKKYIINIFILLNINLFSQNIHANELNNLYQISLENNPNLLSAEANKQNAYEFKNLARAALMPQISATGNLTFNYTDRKFENPFIGAFTANQDEFLSHGFGITARQPIYNRDAFVQIDTVQTRLAQGDLQIEAARQQNIGQLLQYYVQILSQQDALVVTQKYVNNLARHLEMTQKRLAIGVGTKIELLEAQARYENAQVEQYSREREIAETRDYLQTLIGEKYILPKKMPSLSDSLPLKLPQNLAFWQELAQQKNLQIQQANLRTELARLTIEQVKAGHYPLVNLDGSLNYNNNFDAQNGQKGIDGRVSLNVQIPLFTGGAVSTQTRQAALNYESEKATLQTLQREINREIQANWRGMNLALSRRAALQSAVRAAEIAHDATELAFKNGLRTTLEVLDAKQRLAEAEENEKKALYEFLSHLLHLSRDAGQLTPDSIAQFDGFLVQ